MLFNGNQVRYLTGPVITIFTLLVMAACGEVVLRFLPVCTATISLPVNALNPVRRAEPDTEYAYSRNWNMSGFNRVRTNNEGFVNDVSYLDGKLPLTAVIGDSYVEALMVPFQDTITGLLQMAGGQGQRVYSFASSGAPLSEYLAYAEYASKFKPEKLVFVIVGNDFDESLPEHIPAAGFHVFVHDGSGVLKLKRVDSEGSRYAWLLKRSKLANYFFRNLKILELKEQMSGLLEGQPYTGNTPRAADPGRISTSIEVINTFLENLPVLSGVASQNILFLVDGIRPELYDVKERLAAKNSFFSIMREEFIHRSQAGGFQVVDLEPYFIKYFKETGQKVEFPDDGHWNSAGHKIAARAVIEAGWIKTDGSFEK